MEFIPSDSVAVVRSDSRGTRTIEYLPILLDENGGLYVQHRGKYVQPSTVSGFDHIEQDAPYRKVVRNSIMEMEQN